MHGKEDASSLSGYIYCNMTVHRRKVPLDGDTASQAMRSDAFFFRKYRCLILPHRGPCSVMLHKLPGQGQGHGLSACQREQTCTIWPMQTGPWHRIERLASTLLDRGRLHTLPFTQLSQSLSPFSQLGVPKIRRKPSQILALVPGSRNRRPKDPKDL